MHPSISISIILVLLLSYFVIVVLASRQATKRTHRKADDNKKAVLDFYEGVYHYDSKNLPLEELDSNYIQHDPSIAAGRQAFIDHTHALYEKYPGRKIDVKRIIADGDYVVVHCWAINNPSNPGDRGDAVIDIFRLQDKKIMEHWGVTQPVPEKAENTNSMF